MFGEKSASATQNSERLMGQRQESSVMEVRRITAGLQAEARCPTMKLVKSRMARPEYFDYVTFWTILCDEKRRLAID